MSHPEAPAKLIHNRNFRRLWLGDAISLLGDWFTYVAVGALILSTGQGLVAVAILLVGYTLPRAALSPFAGRLADRHERRTILIAASLLRALTVLGMIAAAHAQALGVVQILVFVRAALAAFVDPAATAMLPTLVRREQIGRANTIISATWSVMFGVGVATGGVVTAVVGPIWALGVDALTFLIAAGVFVTLPLARTGTSPSARPEPPPSSSFERGWTIAWSRPEILQAALAKSPVLMASGGAWVLLHHYAGRGQFGALGLGLGLLHAARALGTGLGPVLWFGRLRASVLGLRAGTFLGFLAIVLFALAPSSASVLLAACLWGVGVGATWVSATTRAQILTPNDQLGRVAALDLMLASVSQCLGALVGAWLAERFADPELAVWVGLGGGLAAWLVVGALVMLARGSARTRGAGAARRGRLSRDSGDDS